MDWNLSHSDFLLQEIWCSFLFGGAHLEALLCYFQLCAQRLTPGGAWEANLRVLHAEARHGPLSRRITRIYLLVAGKRVPWGWASERGGISWFIPMVFLGEGSHLVFAGLTITVANICKSNSFLLPDVSGCFIFKKAPLEKLNVYQFSGWWRKRKAYIGESVKWMGMECPLGKQGLHMCLGKIMHTVYSILYLCIKLEAYLASPKYPLGHSLP